MKGLGRVIYFSRINRVVKHWLKIDGTFLSAAVAFYAALALFPLILVLLSIFGWTLASSESVQQWRSHIIDLITERTSEQFAEIVSSQLDIIERNANVSGSIGILTLFAFSIALFSNLERAFDKIWELPKERFGIVSKLKRVLFDRIKAFSMIVVFVGVVVGNFLFNIYLDKVDNLVAETNESEMTWWSVQIASEISVNAIIFMVIFQIMTREKVWWRHAIYGGFLTAILWQPGRYLIATYLISEKYTPFGIVGAFLAVLLWLFYGMNALLFGGTVVHVAGKEREQHELSDSDV